MNNFFIGDIVIIESPIMNIYDWHKNQLIHWLQEDNSIIIEDNKYIFGHSRNKVGKYKLL